MAMTIKFFYKKLNLDNLSNGKKMQSYLKLKI